jgi:hypothetical protein
VKAGDAVLGNGVRKGVFRLCATSSRPLNYDFVISVTGLSKGGDVSMAAGSGRVGGNVEVTGGGGNNGT